uniref:Uncharacterized protein n=1 Tax=Arundo donax TaxID=35708 RepID=A0A0A9H4C2_ARUDO
MRRGPAAASAHPEIAFLTRTSSRLPCYTRRNNLAHKRN